ncbi:hypothetical protein ACXX4F_28190 [Bacillus cereus]
MDRRFRLERILGRSQYLQLRNKGPDVTVWYRGAQSQSQSHFLRFFR